VIKIAMMLQLIRMWNVRSTGHTFDCRTFRFHVATLGKLFTHPMQSLSQISVIWWYQPKDADALQLDMDLASRPMWIR